MTKEMFALECMWDGNKQQTYKTTPGRDDSEKMIRQGCRGDPWGRDQKVKKEPTRPGKNRETSVKPWWKRDPKIRGSEGVAYDALEHEEV